MVTADHYRGRGGGWGAGWIVITHYYEACIKLVSASGGTFRLAVGTEQTTKTTLLGFIQRGQ